MNLLKGKPVIGISCRLARIENDGVFTGTLRQYIHKDYTESVRLAGGIPILLPVISGDESAEAQAALCDGILFSGGADLDPQLYGEDPIPEQGESMRETDEYDLCLLRAALRLKKPILGICRGLQIINVAFGGSLYQDLFAQGGGSLKHNQLAPRMQGTHRMSPEPGSLLSELFPDGVLINSYHHQAIKSLGEGLRVTARAADGVAEGVERSGEGPFLLGVQWHPEMMAGNGDPGQLKIFERFVAAAGDAALMK